MPDDAPLLITPLAPADITAHLLDLAALMQACVEDGASIGYVLPFPRAEAEGFWTRQVLPAVAAGGRTLLAAWRGGRIVGTVQLDTDTPPNQPHRAEVRKLMVHPGQRRRGIARALMAELERQAAARGRRLLTLDTRTGDTAEPLYTTLGYITVGTIPGYCADAADPSRLDATTIMYKAL